VIVTFPKPKVSGRVYFDASAAHVSAGRVEVSHSCSSLEAD
jgi:hypothetical protein